MSEAKRQSSRGKQGQGGRAGQMRQNQALVPAVLRARYIRWRLKLEGETENMGVRWGARMMSDDVSKSRSLVHGWI